MGLKEAIRAYAGDENAMIKSDQNGIESFLFLRWWNELCFDKIRPKWDWKYYGKVISIEPDPEIKSDQNGIERKNTGNMRSGSSR